jgi:hypothetical protein
MKKFGLQSAMEYLMTYGWAILIIAIVMVALFSLGIFGGTPLGTTCLPVSGFVCSGLVLNHVNGYVSFTFGQTTGSDWVQTNVVFVPQGTGSVGGIPSADWANAMSIGSINSGQSVAANVLVVSGGSNAGASFPGTFWARYNSPTSSGGPYYIQVATVQMKAV